MFERVSVGSLSALRLPRLARNVTLRSLYRSINQAAAVTYLQL